jgi:hypothetical protein
MTPEAIQCLPTKTLWAIVRSTHPLTERFCNELTWAKAELKRRGADMVGL